MVYEVAHKAEALNSLLNVPRDTDKARLTVVVGYLLDVFVHVTSLSPTGQPVKEKGSGPGTPFREKGERVSPFPSFLLNYPIVIGITTNAVEY